MKNVLILGAAGQIAKHTIDFLIKKPDIELTLYARNSSRLSRYVSNGTKVIDGDILDAAKLKEAMKGQDVVYANLEGEMDKLAKAIVKEMDETGVKRLIFIASLGIYDEVPGAFGKWNKKMIGNYLEPYRKAADLIEASDLEYIILRPTWLTDADEVDYETSEKNEPVRGTEVSRKSVGSLVAKIIEDPVMNYRRSLGVNKPDTYWDKPSFY